MGHEAVANAAMEAAKTRGLAIAAYRLAARLHNNTRVALGILVLAQVGTWLYLYFRG
jgi:hypothetical protein